ncbi:MAG: 16S rRNA (guanine(966)-N(2))-methyltransferase RsmD [Waddliaceae bacterium]
MHIIAGIYKKKTILTPKGFSTRPTSGRLRETLFNMIQENIREAEFLDLFAGSGAMGLEAISRGAKKTTFIDKQRECTQCMERNVKTFGIEDRTEILQGDVISWIEKLVKRGREFDLIFIDPPYGMKRGEIAVSTYLLEVIDEGPLLRKGGMLFIEEDSSVQLSMTALDHLTLLSKRQIGRSQLWQYEKL